MAPIQPVPPLPFFRVQQITSHHESLFSARAAADRRMSWLIRLPRVRGLGVLLTACVSDGLGSLRFPDATRRWLRNSFAHQGRRPPGELGRFAPFPMGVTR